MALEIDAFDVLRAIAAEPSTFAGIRAEIAKETGKFTDKIRGLLVKWVKASAGDIGAVRSIRRALGADIFNLLVDGMKDGDLKSIVAKLDRHHPEQKSARAGWRRNHFLALIDGSATPAARPVKKRSAAVSGRSKAKAKKLRQDEDEFLHDESAGAVRDRR